MKKTVQHMFVLVCLLFVQSSVWSQSAAEAKPAGPRWVSDQGYWIVENNVHVPKKYVVYFYTNDGQLIHRQNIEGVTLKVHKRRVKMQLRRTLETAIVAWKKSQESVVGSREPGKKSLVNGQ